MDRYAVMGNPVAHSKSPQIHALFAEQCGQQLSYEKLLVPLDGFAAALDAFQASGGKGCNITLPFKEQAWALADLRSERAEAAGAVNTFLFDAQGRRYGDNTDGVGLVRDLRDNHHTRLTGSRVLVLGAGGAVHGLLPTLLQEHPAEVVIANRTLSRAQQLAALFAGAVPVRAVSFTHVAGEAPFQVVINGTSTGLSGEVPPLPPAVVTGTVCYDMLYGDTPTPFLQWAARHNAARTIDGLGMLVEQAAEAFFLWRGVRPATAPVIEALRQAPPA
ncbi:MAG TPA: shikimate dehydrogenase [Gammaproteobacteria bacterium]|nr:shikimate dehydrogenase [Gammaproteobacteria bacterium]